MESWTIIILGATGDLSRKRLIPALYSMLKHKTQLSFVLIGAAKDETSTEALIRESRPEKISKRYFALVLEIFQAPLLYLLQER